MEPIKPRSSEINGVLGSSPGLSDDVESNVSRISQYELVDLAKAIFMDSDSDEYDFHKKVLQEARIYIEIKLEEMGFNPSISIYPRDTKRLYFENPLEEDPYARMWLDFTSSWHQKKIPKRVMEKLVSDLNKEFNLKRRFGLFLLEQGDSSKNYSLGFNPNELNESRFLYTKSERFLVRSLLSTSIHPLDRLNEDELFALHMEDDLMETVLKKHSLADNEIFKSMRNNRTSGLQTWMYPSNLKQEVIKQIDAGNAKYNVEKRAGVFRYKSYGPYFHLWFQVSEGNQGYHDLKNEFLMDDDAIGKVENRYNIVFDNRREWTF